MQKVDVVVPENRDLEAAAEVHAIDFFSPNKMNGRTVAVYKEYCALDFNYGAIHVRDRYLEPLAKTARAVLAAEILNDSR